MPSTSSLSKLSLKRLDEMNSKARHLVELMKRGIVDFIFKKKSNGKIRRAKGTLKRDLIPQEALRKQGRPRKRPDSLVVYFDVEKNAIRSFKDYLLLKVYKNSLKVPKSSLKDLRKELKPDGSREKED